MGGKEKILKYSTSKSFLQVAFDPKLGRGVIRNALKNNEDGGSEHFHGSKCIVEYETPCKDDVWYRYENIDFKNESGEKVTDNSQAGFFMRSL